MQMTHVHVDVHASSADLAVPHNSLEREYVPTRYDVLQSKSMPQHMGFALWRPETSLIERTTNSLLDSPFGERALSTYPDVVSVAHPNEETSYVS